VKLRNKHKEKKAENGKIKSTPNIQETILEYSNTNDLRGFG
jgi:hypothetical protein